VRGYGRTHSLSQKFIIDFHAGRGAGEWSRIKRARSRAGRALARPGPEAPPGPGQKKIESRRVRLVRRVLARLERAACGRLITVAFCGFVARHDPRAFRGPHCSAPNRSRNGVRTVVRRGRVPVVRETGVRTPARAFHQDPSAAQSGRSQDRLRQCSSENFVSIYIYICNLCDNNPENIEDPEEDAKSSNDLSDCIFDCRF